MKENTINLAFMAAPTITGVIFIFILHALGVEAVSYLILFCGVLTSFAMVYNFRKWQAKQQATTPGPDQDACNPRRPH